MSSTEHSEELPPSRRSHQRRRSFRTWLKIIRHWILTHPLDILFGLMILLAIILFINPFPALDVTIDSLPFGFGGFAANVGQWIAYEGGAQLSGGVFVVAAISIVLIRIRQIVLYKESLWSNVCPNCESRFTLKRTHRTNIDKLLNMMQVPIRRYQCKSCEWEGRRIDEEII